MKNTLILSTLVSVFSLSAAAAFSGIAFVQPGKDAAASSDIPRITIVAKRLTPAEKAMMLQQEREQTAGKAAAGKQA
jgi:hypothetical protein